MILSQKLYLEDCLKGRVDKLDSEHRCFGSMFILEGLMSIWVVCFAAATLVFLWRLVFNYLVLSHIPSAGLTAPISRLLWAFFQEHSGRVTLVLPTLHGKLGPLVRIGPKECSFYSLELYKTVCSAGSPWTKDPRVYGQFVQDGHPALFSITNPQEHAQRRRLMGQVFNRSKMPLLESIMHEQTSKFLQAIRIYGSTVDLMPACRALEADIVSSFGFGSAIGGIDAWKRHQELDIVAENDNMSQWLALYSNLPGLISFSLKVQRMLYAVTGWQSRTTQVMKKFDQWSRSQLESIVSHKQMSTVAPSFIEVMIRSGLPPETALSEAKEMLGPGTETTSATLAHIIWGLAHDQQYQSDLVTDLDVAGWPKDMKGLESIPRLRAAVKEGVRWTGAAAAMLPRVAPQGGAISDGKFIPEGTVLSSSPIWYLHDEVAFPSPRTYRPQRWLEDASVNPLRDDFYIPFSKGSNTCVGSHFAYLELYIALSQVLRHFHIGLLRPSRTDRIAVLPPRKEWVSAVPLVKLEAHFSLRREQ